MRGQWDHGRGASGFAILLCNADGCEEGAFDV